MVYIVGAGTTRSEVLRLDPVSGAWTVLASTSTPTVYATSFVLGGSLFSAGGLLSKRHVERYDVAADTWTEVADMLEERAFFGAATIRQANPAEDQGLFDALIVKASRECM